MLRSTKAGASTPATRTEPSTSASTRSTLNEGRGINPGDTFRIHFGLYRISDPLNEGRGINPGDTLVCRCLDYHSQNPLNEGRGINPGDTSHHPEGRRQGVERSTKAGASTPATPGTITTVAVELLHRSTKAGASTPATPLYFRPYSSPLAAAQRRPGHQPRRHSFRFCARLHRSAAQRRPGHQPRRHWITLHS